MSNSTPNLLTLLIAGVIAASPALADDVVVELDTGDEFVVQDGRSSLRTLVLDGEGGANQSATAILRGNSSPEVHPLCLYQNDGGNPTRRGTWLWKGGGGAVTNLSLKVDGWVSINADPETQQCEFNPGGDPTYPDPNKVGGSIPAMIQIGADVEQALLLRSSGTGCVGCSPARPDTKLILGIDRGQDWVWKVEGDGTQCWGDPGPTGGSGSDGGQGVESFDVCLDRIENGNDEFVRFTLDIDNDGAGTREIDIVRPVIQGTGVTSHGGTMWGNTADSGFDSGDEVCASVPGAGLSCHATLDPKDGSEHSCTGTMPETSTSGLFYALCY